MITPSQEKAGWSQPADLEEAEVLVENYQVQCPYCFEWVEIWMESDVQGRLIQDCEVCCRPWQLTFTRDEEDQAQVHVERAD